MAKKDKRETEFYTGDTNRVAKGRFVTLTPSGTISVSVELAEGINLKETDGCRVGFCKEANAIILRPTSRQEVGALAWASKTRPGQAFRISGAGALRHFSLLPSMVTRYKAEWEDGEIVVDRNAVIDRTAARKVKPKPAAEAGKDTTTWLGKVICNECGREVAYRKLNGRNVLRKHKDPDGVDCHGGGD